MAQERIEPQPQSPTSFGGYADALFGLANTYVNARFSERSSEVPEPANQALGNTDVIYQPERGATNDGRTIVADESGVNYRQIAVYGGLGLAAVLVLAGAYRMIR